MTMYQPLKMPFFPFMACRASYMAMAFALLRSLWILERSWPGVRAAVLGRRAGGERAM